MSSGRVLVLEYDEDDEGYDMKWEDTGEEVTISDIQWEYGVEGREALFDYVKDLEPNNAKVSMNQLLGE